MNPSDPQYPQSPRVAVGAVVFKENRVLLVRRGKPPAKGLWAIPGGSVNLGERLSKAAEREILEETNVVVKAREPVFTFDMVEHDGQGRIRFHYVIIDLVADYVSGEPSSGDDAADARWVSAEDLATLPVSSTTLNLLKTQFQFGAP